MRLGQRFREVFDLLFAQIDEPGEFQCRVDDRGLRSPEAHPYGRTERPLAARWSFWLSEGKLSSSRSHRESRNSGRVCELKRKRFEKTQIRERERHGGSAGVGAVSRRIRR